MDSLDLSSDPKSMNNRWGHITKLLERPGKIVGASFEPGPDNLTLLARVNVLIVGAGGLGCELLKNMALSGFCNLHVIDMDIIDISNLNRQFLFRYSDVGKSKAEVAAKAICTRIPGCIVTPYFCKIQDKDSSFYAGFDLVICGLDSVFARRWINHMLVSLLDYNDEGEICGGVIPLIDGGTEGFKGNARVIIPGTSPCIECTIDLFPPQVNFPMCTIAHTPRLPEHCVEYVRMILWEKEKPFKDANIDGDNPDHVDWIYKQSQDRANEFGISGVNLRLTKGVIKHIIPAVASTNAVIAASCALEAFKIATECGPYMQNYQNFSVMEGVYCGVVQMEKRDDCPVCSRVPQKLEFSYQTTLKEVVDQFINDSHYQLKSPSLKSSTITLYWSSIPSLEMKTRPNLKKTLKELGLENGDEILVSDVSLPEPLQFRLVLTSQIQMDSN